MKILLTGGTGFIGNKVGQELVRQGHQVVTLSRSPERARARLSYPCEVYPWDGSKEIVPQEAVQSVDAVFNMIGEGIADERWTPKRKKELSDSRVRATENLVRSLENSSNLKVFVSFSAIGFYGDQKDKELSEDSGKGEGFLADLCEKWEDAALRLQVDHPHARVVIPRLGVVLGENQGFLGRLEPIFRSGLGGRLGSGQQYVSWIHIEDVVQFLLNTLDNSDIHGLYNLVAPESLTNQSLTHQLADALQVHVGPPVPRIALKLLYGEMSRALLDSQKIQPQRLSSFPFKHRTFKQGIEAVFQGLKKGEARWVSEQWVFQRPSEVWSFFASESNLEEITPSSLHFEVLKKSTDQIKEGTEIDYRLRIHGIPAKWKSLISVWQPPRLFVDEQLKGPYSKWHHSHHLLELGEGTLLRDEVVFKLPLGSLGQMGAFALVKKDIQNIFSYRAQMIDERFSYSPHRSH